MNELTGAFMRAREKGENQNITRQSLANAGYTISEIEEAYRESTQIAIPASTALPITKKNQNKKTKFLWIILIVLILILIGVSLIIFLNYREGADVFSTKGFSIISEFFKGLFKKD